MSRIGFRCLGEAKEQRRCVFRLYLVQYMRWAWVRMLPVVIRTIRALHLCGTPFNPEGTRDAVVRKGLLWWMNGEWYERAVCHQFQWCGRRGRERERCGRG